MTSEQGLYLAHAIGARAFSRRRFLAAGSALGATLAIPGVAFAQKTEIHDLHGTVRVNGALADRKTIIRPGDTVVTGSDGYVVFVIGEDAYMLRSRSELRIEKPAEVSAVVGLLNLVTGALGAVFKRGNKRTILAGTITAGIRGTGVYMETRGDGTYFCTCYGEVFLEANDDTRDFEVIESKRHTPRLIANRPQGGTRFKPAPFETHTDAEMDMLEKCVGRRSPLVVPEGATK